MRDRYFVLQFQAVVVFLGDVTPYAVSASWAASVGPMTAQLNVLATGVVFGGKVSIATGRIENVVVALEFLGEAGFSKRRYD